MQSAPTVWNLYRADAIGPYTVGNLYRADAIGPYTVGNLYRADAMQPLRCGIFIGPMQSAPTVGNLYRADAIGPYTVGNLYQLLFHQQQFLRGAVRAGGDVEQVHARRQRRAVESHFMMSGGEQSGGQACHLAAL